MDDKISIDGIDYVRVDRLPAPHVPGRPVIVRTYSAGVHFGYLVRKTGQEVELSGARRLWSWKVKNGGVALSGVAVKGIDAGCKVDARVSVILDQVIEVIACEPAAAATIEAYP
jgi:hypothetical protein